MNLLYANDRQGHLSLHSWYAATATRNWTRIERLKGQTRADVCVVGAGYTGSVGGAASGRSLAMTWLLIWRRIASALAPPGAMAASWAVASGWTQDRAGKADGPARMPPGFGRWPKTPRTWSNPWSTKHKIECHLKPGIAHACFTARDRSPKNTPTPTICARSGMAMTGSKHLDA